MRVPVPGITIRLGHVPMPSETVAGAAGDCVLVIATTVSELGTRIQSVYVGHEGVDTAVTRLDVTPYERVLEQDTRPRDSLPVTHARDRCLVDHLQHVREALDRQVDATAAVDVDDETIDRAAAGAW